MRDLKTQIISHIFNLGIIIGIFLILFYKLWYFAIILSLYLLIFLIITIFKHVIIKFDLIEYKIIMFIFKFKSHYSPDKLKKYIIEKKFGIIYKNNVINPNLYKITKDFQEFTPIICKFLLNHPILLNQTTQQFQKLIKNCMFHEFDVDSINEISSYFKITPMELAVNLIHNKKLTKIEKDRLIFEVGFQELKLLENNLPYDSEILQIIYDRQKIPIKNGLQIIK